MAAASRGSMSRASRASVSMQPADRKSVTIASRLGRANGMAPVRRGSVYMADSEQPREVYNVTNVPFRVPLSVGKEAAQEATAVFLRHPFFAGLRDNLVEVLATQTHRREYFTVPTPNMARDQPIAAVGATIVVEDTADLSSDFLWVIESGTVLAVENGEELGSLGVGAVFGEAYAFECTKKQPLTIKLTEDPLHVLCVSNSAVHALLFANKFSISQPMQNFMAKQWKHLMWQRVSRLNFFSHCSGALQTQLERKCNLVFKQAGTKVTVSGQKADSALIILRGSVFVMNDKVRSGAVPRKSLQQTMATTISVKKELLKKKSGGKSSRGAGAASPKPRRQSADTGPTSARAAGSTAEMMGKLASAGAVLTTVTRRGSNQDVGRAPGSGRKSSTTAAADADSGVASTDGAQSTAGGARSPAAYASELPTGASPSELSSESDDDGDCAVGCGESSDDLLSASGDLSDSEDDGLSCDSSEYSGDDDYELPEEYACMEPEDYGFEAAAGRLGALMLGDGVLLTFQDCRTRTVNAKKDCAILELKLDDFLWNLRRFPAETKRFHQMQTAEYQEWKKCGMSSLASVDILKRTSAGFLELLAQTAKPKLYFTGDVMIEEGSAPGGLMLLMVGKTEAKKADGSVEVQKSPQSFGSLKWLGANVVDDCNEFRAKELCQVIIIEMDNLLQALHRFPGESTQMVLQVRKHNGQSMNLANTASKREKLADGKGSTGGSNKAMWHVHFCQGASPAFLQLLTQSIEMGSIIPGMSFLQTGENPDFMVMLLDGTIEVYDPRQLCCSDPPRSTPAPMMVCGWDRNSGIQATATSLCDVHRLSVEAARQLGEQFPEDARKFFTKLMLFQQRIEYGMKLPWWSPTAAIWRLDPFTGSADQFVRDVAAQIELKVYMPGEKIVEEAALTDSTLILESGTCNIEKRTLKSLWNHEVVKSISDGHWIGGVGGLCGFATDLRRSATVRATTVCKVFRLATEAVVRVLDRTPHERQRFRQTAERLLREKETDRLEDHAFFADFSRQFLNLLRPKCRVMVFFANEALLEQGQKTDALFILGPQSHIVLESDGKRIKEIWGHHCLGITALIGSRPVRCVSSVITLTTCAVRVLTKEDWVDALKLYPKHREWIDSFTRTRLGKIQEARKEVMKRRAWEKIKKRDALANVAHADRLTRGFGRFPPSPRRSAEAAEGSVDAAAGDATAHAAEVSPALDDASAKRKEDGREACACFNGAQAMLPHTRLPQLTAPLAPPKHASRRLSQDMEFDSELEEYSPERARSSFSRRPSATSGRSGWEEAEEALGMKATLMYNAPPVPLGPP